MDFIFLFINIIFYFKYLKYSIAIVFQLCKFSCMSAEMILIIKLLFKRSLFIIY